MSITINGEKLNQNKILEQLDQYSTLETIKNLRQETGIGLKEAHEIVTNLSNNPNFYDNTIYTINHRREVNIKLDPSSIEDFQNSNTLIVDGYTFDGQILLPLIKQNKKIEAIKYVQKTTGLGLKESKKIVTKIADTPLSNNNLINQHLEELDLPLLSDNIDSTGISHKKNTFDSKTIQKKQSKRNYSPQKGSHFIKDKPSSFKKYLIWILFIAITVYLYFYLNQ